MARKRTRMQKIRDIIRVRLDTQLSERQIARALRVSRSVVGKTLAQFRASGLSRETAEAMSDNELEQALWRRTLWRPIRGTRRCPSGSPPWSWNSSRRA